MIWKQSYDWKQSTSQIYPNYRLFSNTITIYCGYYWKGIFALILYNTLVLIGLDRPIKKADKQVAVKEIIHLITKQIKPSDGIK